MRTGVHVTYTRINVATELIESFFLIHDFEPYSWRPAAFWQYPESIQITPITVEKHRSILQNSYPTLASNTYVPPMHACLEYMYYIGPAGPMPHGAYMYTVLPCMH
jgi:hypothetical protein